MRLADTIAIGALIRCPVCRNILGEQVEGVAVVRYKARKMVALAVSCGRHGCPGVWVAADYLEVVRAVVRAVPTVGVA